MSKNPASLIFVELQFLSLIFIFLTGPVVLYNFFLVLEIFAITLGIWSVILMFGFSKLSITPEVANDSKLLVKGPYKFIRHPMYLSLLLLSLTLILNYFTFTRFIFLIILLVDLLFKISYEEKMLSKHFKKYSSYKQQTKKLIPFIY